MARFMPRGMPGLVFWALLLMTATSSYVTIEPAPCDVMFVVFAPLLLLTGYFALVWPMNPVMYLGGALFFVLNAISMIMAYEPWVSARYWAITVYLVLFWLLIVSLVARFGPAAYRVINGGFQVAALITAIIGILAGLRLIPNWNDFMLTENGERIRSTFKDSNVLGPYLVAAASMLIADTIVARRFRLWRVICLMIYAVAILLTFSRGAYLAGVVTIGALIGLFCSLGKYRGSVDWLAVRMVPVGILFFIASVFVLEKVNLTEFFINRFAYQSYDDERFMNQQDILNTVGQKPIGIGPGSWNLHHYVHDVHSLFLRTWVEHGHLALIGLIVFLGAWFLDTWRGVRRPGPYQDIYVVCFAVVFGIMSNSFSIDTVHWRHLILFLALPVGLLSYEVHRDPAQDPDARLQRLARQSPWGRLEIWVPVPRADAGLESVNLRDHPRQVSQVGQ
jgi:O-antigen ligase